MFCPKCGAPNFDDADYCVSCATRLTPYEDNSPQVSENNPAVPVGERVKDKIAAKPKQWYHNPWAVVGLIAGVCVVALAIVVALLIVTGNQAPEPVDEPPIAIENANANADSSSTNANENVTVQIDYDSYLDVYGTPYISAFTELTGTELVDLLDYSGATWSSEEQGYVMKDGATVCKLIRGDGDVCPRSDWGYDGYISELPQDMAYSLEDGLSNYRGYTEFLDESNVRGLLFEAESDAGGPNRSYAYGTDEKGGTFVIFGGPLFGYHTGYYIGNDKFIMKDGACQVFWQLSPNKHKDGDPEKLWQSILEECGASVDSTVAENERHWTIIGSDKPLS